MILELFSDEEIRSTLMMIYDRMVVVDKSSLEVDVDFDNNVIDDSIDKLFYIFSYKEYTPKILEYSFDIHALKVGALLDTCMWQDHDNGDTQSKFTNEWLFSNDPRKIEVALSIRGVYPHKNFGNLVFRLIEIKNQFQSLHYICDYWLNEIETYLLEESSFDSSYIFEKPKKKGCMTTIMAHINKKLYGGNN